MMTVYAIAQLRFQDRIAYDRYQARFMDVFRLFAGQLMAADERPQVIEGSWAFQKVVLMSFHNEEAFRAWADSPEYQAISRDRRANTEAIVLLAAGVNAA